MSRIMKLFLSLLAIIAVVSLGFAAFGAINSASGQANSKVIPALSAASNSDVITGTNQGLAPPKVGPQLAGLCALYKLPGGTVIDNVNGVYNGLTFPYYQVKLHFGNYAYTRYINGYDCYVIPDPNAACNLTNSCTNQMLASIVVSQQLAGLCALHKLPYGTVVDKITTAIAEFPHPYYKVSLHFGNYSYTRYIDATNCNIIPNPN